MFVLVTLTTFQIIAIAAIALITGAFIGLFLMAVMNAASYADDQSEFINNQ